MGAPVKAAERLHIDAQYYRQFDADFARDVPGEGYGGWQREAVELDRARIGVALMHAWDTGSRDDYPGWHRAVEYMPRAQEIGQQVLPPLLAALRRAGMPLFHVVGGGGYYQEYPGYKRAVALAGPPSPAPQRIEADEGLQALHRLRQEKAFPGGHNLADIGRGFDKLDFMPQARPQGEEGVAENGDQLFALCQEQGVNHLIYAGFAINWCLLLSPGGMADMQKRGFMCSALRQAVTAVENKETARGELAKEIGLWRVAVAFGFVFDVDDLVAALAAE